MTTKTKDIITYSVCTDCYMTEATGDESYLDYYYGEDANIREAEIDNGFNALLADGGYLVAGDDIAEYDTSTCECCGSVVAGKRHELIVIK